MLNFHLSNFKFSAGAYGSIKLAATSKEVYHDYVPFLDTFKPTLDSLLSSALGGTFFSGLNLFDLFITPLVPNYNKDNTHINDTPKGIPTFYTGLIGDVSYTFSNNVNLGLRINYPLSTFQPHPNYHYVRNTQFTASLSYNILFKPTRGKKSKAMNAH